MNVSYIINGYAFTRVNADDAKVFVCQAIGPSRPKAGEVMIAMYEFMGDYPGVMSVHHEYATRQRGGYEYTEVLSVFRDGLEGGGD